MKFEPHGGGAGGGGGGVRPWGKEDEVGHKMRGGGWGMNEEEEELGW